MGAWEPVLRKALALSPSERWRSASELLAALEVNVGQPLANAVVAANVRDAGSGGRAAPAVEFRSGSTVLLPDPTSPKAGTPAPLKAAPTRAPVRRRAGLWIAGGAAVLLATGAAVLLRRGPEQKPPQALRGEEPPALAPTPPAAPPVKAAAPSETKAPTAPAPSAEAKGATAAGDDAGRDLVRIQIRTEPPEATLTLDHHEVHNPYSAKSPRGHHLHDIVATFAGSGEAREMVAFDRDRDLVLRRGAPASHGRLAAPAAAPTPEGQPDAPAAGYRGSKLKIETEFP